MTKKTAPGKEGRIAAIGQTHGPQGHFTKKLPTPVDEAAIEAIVVRREQAIVQAENWRPTAEEWSALTTESLRMYRDGHTFDSIATAMSLPEYTIRRAVARGVALSQVGQDPLATHEWAEATLIAVIERALEVDELEEARKATVDLARLKGYISNAGGTMVNVLTKSEGEVQIEVKEWIQRQDVQSGVLPKEQGKNQGT